MLKQTPPCGDHMHIVLVCEENEVSKIVGKLKSMSARTCNIEMGRTSTILLSEQNKISLGETQAQLWKLL